MRQYPKDQISNIEHKLLPELFDYLNVNVFIIDTQGFYIYKNSSLTDIVGKVKKAANDEGWQSCLEVMKTGNPQKIEEEHNCRWYLSVKKPFLDDNNNIIGVLGISIDITDRKKAEDYRREATEKVIKFTNLVAGSIAHELRTPLAGINMQMDLLEMTINSPKLTAQDKFDTIRSSAKSIKSTIKASSHVIDDMLLKVRTFATGQVPQKSFEEISITADIENLLESFPFEGNQQELVNVSYKTRFKYLGDKVLTNHLIGNLLKNALHAIKEADKGDITIELKADGNFNQLIFRDTALGIPEDFVGKVFDQFETKKTTHGGTGLGLAFCKMVMEYYDGNITCNSKHGEYTEFVLNFPKL